MNVVRHPSTGAARKGAYRNRSAVHIATLNTNPPQTAVCTVNGTLAATIRAARPPISEDHSQKDSTGTTMHTFTIDLSPEAIEKILSAL